MVIGINQDNIVKARPHGPMLVTGGKGSGKTSIGIKKAAYLLDNYCLDSDDKILFVNNSKFFIEHSSYLMKRIEQEKSKTLMDLIQVRQNKISISSIDDMVYKYYKKFCSSNNLNFEIYDEINYYLEILHDGIDALKMEYPNVIYLDKKYQQFLLAEIEWIRACGYYDEQQYQNAERIGLQDFDREGPHKLNMNSSSRKAIFELMIYFSDCCKSKGKINYVEANIMAIDSVIAENCEQYTHVIIDDCHEFTKIQLDLITKLYKPKKHSSITFLFDDAGKSHPLSWLGQGRPFTTVGFDMTGRTKTLDIAINNFKDSNHQKDSRYNRDCNITYKEISETEKLMSYIVNIVREDMLDEDFSIELKSENTKFKLYKSQNMLIISRKNE